MRWFGPKTGDCLPFTQAVLGEGSKPFSLRQNYALCIVFVQRDLQGSAYLHYHLVPPTPEEGIPNELPPVPERKRPLPRELLELEE